MRERASIRSRYRAVEGGLPLVLAVLFFSLIAGCVTAPKLKGQDSSVQLVLISVDGLRPEFYRDEAYPAATLRAAARAGVSAAGLIPIFPSLTYPVHASLVTGVSSAKHGILSNTIFDPAKGLTDRWYWSGAPLKRPALWDTAKAAGKSVAIIRWPASLGANVDWMIPEIFHSPGFDFKQDWALIRENTSPALMEELTGSTGIQGIGSLKELDEFTTSAAELILGRHRPNLTFIHLVNLDFAQHLTGRDSSATKAALEHTDHLLKRILSRIDLAQAVVLIVGDHGFQNYGKIFHPNALFSRLGWLKAEGGKVTDWRVQAHLESGIAVIYVKDDRGEDRGDDRIAPEVRRELEKHARGRYRILDRAELKRRQAYPDAFCVIEALEGNAFGTNLAGELETVLKGVRGAHGPRPFDARLHSGFIAVGRNIPAGKDLGLIHALDVAPTVAAILGLTLGEAESRALELQRGN